MDLAELKKVFIPYCNIEIMEYEQTRTKGVYKLLNDFKLRLEFNEYFLNDVTDIKINLNEPCQVCFINNISNEKISLKLADIDFIDVTDWYKSHSFAEYIEELNSIKATDGQFILNQADIKPMQIIEIYRFLLMGSNATDYEVLKALHSLYKMSNDDLYKLLDKGIKENEIKLIFDN